MNAFHLLQGSVIGREHARVGRNNQDAAVARRRPDAIAAVVADGCSSGRFSEIGARLGATFLAEHLAATRPEDAAGLDASARALRAFLRSLSLDLLQRDPAGLAAAVHDHLLFTVLGAVVTPARALVFGVGDGVFSLNGEATVIDPGPDNAPPYIGYDLLPSREAGGERAGTAFTVHLDVPTAKVQTLLVGTDGLVDLMQRAHEPLKNGEPQGGLAQFEVDDALFKSPLLLQKRLVVIGEANRRLRDDTTVIVLRRA